MNYTETFDQFASRLGPTDLALYAGAGIIIWILFKDKLSPIQKLLTDLVNSRVKNSEPKPATAVNTDSILSGVFTNGSTNTINTQAQNKDNFYNLVVSWKQTRDLAVKSGCLKAVDVADQMFPFLSPSVCEKENTNE
jgi:hypothetical protein